MMDDFFRGMNELRAAQENTDVKIAALLDAQIRAEDEIKTIRAEMREGMNELRDVVRDLCGKLDRLTNIVIAHVTDPNAHTNNSKRESE